MFNLMIGMGCVVTRSEYLKGLNEGNFEELRMILGPVGVDGVDADRKWITCNYLSTEIGEFTDLVYTTDGENIRIELSVITLRKLGLIESYEYTNKMGIIVTGKLLDSPLVGLNENATHTYPDKITLVNNYGRLGIVQNKCYSYNAEYDASSINFLSLITDAEFSFV